MTLNLVVPCGAVRFVIHDDREHSASRGAFQEVILSRRDNHARLTIPPMLWMGFQGLEEPVNLVLNVADLEHDPAEADHVAADQFTYCWPTT
jgi:dTDP-4-dehydrorhamnose 3,5-epimerase